jgi:hypothetical protein
MKIIYLPIILLNLVNCPCIETAKADSPERAVEIFIEGIKKKDQKQVFNILASKIQKQLIQKAKEAQRMSGQNFNPEEMLAIHYLPIKWKIKSIKAYPIKPNLMNVKLLKEDNSFIEIKVVREKSNWRIILSLNKRKEEQR